MISKIKQRWLSSPIARALLTLVSGQALGQVLGVITTPIVSRLYDTTEFGKFAIITSTATIVTSMSQAGLASAIMIPDEENEAKKVFSTVFWVQLVIITLFFVIAIILMPCYEFFHVGIPYILALILLYIYMLLTNFSYLLRIYMNRNGFYRSLFWNSLIGALSTLCVTIPLGITGIGFMGLIIAALVSAILCIVQMMLKANPLVKISFGDIVDKIKEYKDFVLYQFPSNAIVTFTEQLPNQMLSMGFGSAGLGSYSMSDKICNIPIRLVASPVNTVYFKTAVEYKQKNKDLSSFTFSLIRIIMLSALIPLILLLTFGGTIFAFVLGEKWRQAGQISAILGFQYVLVFCAICVGYCRVAIGRQKMNFFMSIIQLTIIALSLTIGLHISKSIITVITLFSIGNSIYQIFDMTINFYCMKKNMLKYLSFVATYCLAAFGISFVLRYLIK